MLSKVAKRVRRRSVQPAVPPEGETWAEVSREIVQDAPDLVRWTNILDIAFPRVAMGGYARYYASKSSQKFPQSPQFCPVLSQFPLPSPSKEVPSTSPLFSTTAKQHRLAVIHEVSTESIAFTHPRALVSICTSLTTNDGGGPGPKSSLRRKRRQLLRTPSIERDFAVHSRHLFSPSSNGSDNENDNDTSSLEVPVSHGGGSTHSHSYSTNSTNSHSSQSGDHNSDYLLTPSTSVEGAEDGDVSRVTKRLEEEHKNLKDGDGDALEDWMKTLKFLEPPSRRASATSFSTAQSEFDDGPVVLHADRVDQGLTPLMNRN